MKRAQAGQSACPVFPCRVPERDTGTGSIMFPPRTTRTTVPALNSGHLPPSARKRNQIPPLLDPPWPHQLFRQSGVAGARRAGELLHFESSRSDVPVPALCLQSWAAAPSVQHGGPAPLAARVEPLPVRARWSMAVLLQHSQFAAALPRPAELVRPQTEALEQENPVTLLRCEENG